MLPLYLLTSAKNQPILVELKNGESLNGQLVNCDSWMNLTLKDVIQSSSNGETFVKLPECYIRGNHIKYLRLPEEIMDYAKEQNILNMEQRNRNQRRRTGGGNYNNRRNYNNQNNNRNGGYNNRRQNQNQNQSQNQNQGHSYSSHGHGQGHGQGQGNGANQSKF